MEKHPLLRWSDQHYIGGQGILVASDEAQEWMLKWWWDNYSKHNQYPVTFFDFGMSKSARMWCETKGKVISFSLPDNWISEKSHISSERIQEWEAVYSGNPWNSRKQWFYKPYLFLQTPYDESIWLDLDCEVRGKIDSLFDYAKQGDGFSVVKLSLNDQVVHNSGVLAFKRFSPIIDKWVDNVQSRHKEFLGDENLLIETLYENGFDIQFFPLTYNWPSLIDRSANAVILHHLSEPGKTQIFKKLCS